MPRLPLNNGRDGELTAAGRQLMHELALCESVVRIVEETARAHAATRVTTVRLKVGALSCASADAIDFCFRAVSRGTIAEDATLEVIRVPGQAFCLDCEATVAVDQRYDPCPRCGSHQVRLTAGEELSVAELEVV